MTPDEFTNRELMLDVGDGHQLYVQDWGKADAKTPIIYLHGGPGNGCDNRDKRGFEARRQRVIFHDQRGAGKSLPTGSLEHNTTQDLVADIEKITQHLALEQGVLVGGSWGSTLALMYGIAHPEQVTGMVLNGVFTATRAELDWLAGGGWRKFFPEIWETYIASVPAKHQANPTAYHIEQALGNDAEAAKQSAYAYQAMELALLKLDDIYDPGPYDTYDPAVIRTEMHYDAHQFFVEDGYVAANAAKLTMPIRLIAGRYDMVTPPQAAYELSQQLPNGHLVWTINGHLRQHEAKNIQELLLNKLQGEA
jgi:proline iminopeptidase